METNTAFAEYRKNGRKALAVVAAEFGVHRTTILRWEKGEPPLPIKRLSEAEKITGICRERLRPDIYWSLGDKR